MHAPLEFLRSRRSVRRFLPQPLPPALLERLIETATYAPSAHHRQPWRFAVLLGMQIKARLAQQLSRAFAVALQADGLSVAEAQERAERSRQRIEQAPAVVLLCLDTGEMDVYPDPPRQELERQMAAQSAALAGGTLLLAAHAEGLGAVWLCAPLFAPQAAQSALALPLSWQPQALILLGYPAAIPAARPRKPLAEVARFYYEETQDETFV